MTLLSVKELSVSYNGVRAVSHVSFSMEKGDFISLIGANGAGKSSTLKSIIGLVKEKQGTIRFENEEILNCSPEQIVAKGISLCPEGRRIFSTMSIDENLKMGAFLRNDKEEIKRDIDKVYHYFPILKEKRNLPGGSLSGGQQQMLAIGRSLMTKPKLLLIDELTLGLAPLVIKDLMNILIQLNREGLSIILVEQNANVALKTSTFGYVMENGKITMRDHSCNLIGNEFVQKAYLGI